MGNLTVSSKLKNKKSKRLGLWLKLLLCQFVVMLALIPNTFAIFMDNVWIDGKQTSINWCFNSDKLIRANGNGESGAETTLGWTGEQDFTYTFTVSGVENGVSTDIDIDYVVSAILKADGSLPAGVAVSVDSYSGKITKNTTETKMHTVTLSYTGTEPLRDVKFDLVISATTATNASNPVKDTLKATYHIEVPALVEYSVQDKAGNSNVEVQIQTHTSTTGYINFAWTFDAGLVTPVITDAYRYARVSGNTMILTLESNKNYSLKFEKADSSADYSSGTSAGSCAWQEEAYLVTFDGNKGKGSEDPKILGLSPVDGVYSTAYVSGRNIDMLPTARRNNYTFLGWFSATENGNQIKAGDAFSATDNGTVWYAQWQPNAVKVTFDGNTAAESSTWTLGEKALGDYFNGVGTGSSIFAYARINYKFGLLSKTQDGEFVDVGALPTATKTGYTFAGWWTAKDGGDEVTAGTINTNTTDVTLYAHWTPNQYTITIEENTTGDTTATVTFDALTPTFNTGTKSGYTLTGFVIKDTQTRLFDEKGAPIASVIGYTDASKNWIKADDVTVVAQWKANTITVTADPNGGAIANANGWQTSTGGTVKKDLIFDAAYGTLPTATRAGWTFVNWMFDGGVITAETILKTAHDHTITAEWQANTYTITANNGADDNITQNFEFDNNQYNTSTEAQSRTIKTAPARTGWTLSGYKVSWTNDDHAANSFLPADIAKDGTVLNIPANCYGDITVTAQWTANTYIITVEDNEEGTGSERVTIASLTPTLETGKKDGYTLNGYNVKNTTTKLFDETGAPIASVTGYTDANKNWMHAGDVTVVAQWTANTYKLIYETNGGDAIASIDKVYNTAFTVDELKAATRTGYTFTGWFGKSTLDERLSTTNAFNKDDVTFDLEAGEGRIYAGWKAFEYEVRFNKNADDATGILMFSLWQHFSYLQN